MTENNGTPKPTPDKNGDGKPELVIGENAFRLSIVYSNDNRILIELDEAPERFQNPQEIINLLALAAKSVNDKIAKETSKIHVAHDIPKGIRFPGKNTP